MNIEMETLEHGVTGVYTLGEASSNTYMKTYYNWNIQIISGKYRIIKTYIHIDMAIGVYEYRRGDKCVYMRVIIYHSPLVVCL